VVGLPLIMAKKNLNKIPKDIYQKIEKIRGDAVVVGCAIKVKAEDLLAGKLTNLGINLTSKGLEVPSSVVPNKDQGKYSGRNINGHEIVRKDLAKETHYNNVETPNWGHYGTHTVHLPYEKYPRDFFPPRELEILINPVETKPNLSAYVISFKVQEVLSKKEKNFEKKLLENLNLLQENVGACGVEPADMAIKDYAKTLHVSWEILPPGTLDETVERIFRGKKPTVQQKDTIKERYDFFQTLKPQSLVFGQSGFRRYFGALLEKDLVVFENVEYGNAVYVLFENWEELSKLSRLDLMSGKFGNSFERITHISGWKGKVRTAVAYYRNEIKLKK